MGSSAAGGGRSDGEWPPWPPPRPLPQPPAERRAFDAEGRSWLAWVAGGGVGGTGSYNLALIEAVHFAPAAEPDRPQREALVAHGVFAGLHDEELVVLLRRAQHLSTGEPTEAPRGRGGAAGRGGGPRRPRG